jgi:hypothetical protein
MSREERLNARFRAKMEARVTGQAPVFVEPPKVTAEGDDQAAIDERWRQKLNLRDAQRAPVSAVAASEPVALPETEADRKKRERAEARAKADAEAAQLKADEEKAKAKADAVAAAKAKQASGKELTTEELELLTAPTK